jgi:hypothetical protein
VYTLGESTHNAPAVHPWSIGAMLAKAVHVLAYLSPSLPQALDLHTNSRRLSYTQITFWEFLRQLWRSDWAEGKDATPYAVTFEAAENLENMGEGSCNSRTFYTSYAAYMVSCCCQTHRYHF